MPWLQEYSGWAAKTDRFAGDPDHLTLLGTGLLSEAGSVLAEIKKKQRERDAYPDYRRRMIEEIGDFLWYYTRLVTSVKPSLLSDLEGLTEVPGDLSLAPFLEFGAAVGEVLSSLNANAGGDELTPGLLRTWRALLSVCRYGDIALSKAAADNILKTASRWPTQRTYAPLFDDEAPEEERLPRHLDIEFRERLLDSGLKVVVLRCNTLNVGDRVSDNIQDSDGYRFHDVFHFAHAVHLGWSPVIRALLRCKRKSRPRIDEGEDGARAIILEEALAAVVFSRAKHLGFFDGLDHVDYDLLKTVHGFLEGFEVARVPLWQWEQAILDGYRAFRQLRNNSGGRVTIDLNLRALRYIAPS